tara:strand:- start:243 stop:533 length:291 start_codon:yes stop_codon:yes gene_type:complete
MSKQTLTRIEIADSLNKELGISLSESNYFVDQIIDEIINSLVSTKKIKISSFGTLKTRFKKSRIGRNPKTGEEHSISSRNTLSFVPSKVLKNKINN